MEVVRTPPMSNELQKPLTPHDARRLAAFAGVHPETAQRFAAGHPVRSPQRAHILAALAAHPDLQRLVDAARASTTAEAPVTPP